MGNLTLTSPPRAIASVPRPARYLLPLGLLTMLAGCDHRVASQKTIDVCSLLRESAATLLQETPMSEGESFPPSAGRCSFTARSGPNKRGPVSVTVMTSASMEPDDVSRSARILLAETEQTYGAAGTGEFGELAKLGVTFSIAPGNARQIILGERGVLVEIGLGSGGFGQEHVATFVKDVWTRVLASRSPKP